ncbi:hypothetical protein HKT18_04680 [Flavobacterium sp. IMCC34852]|uniref:Uncharacterized protein n=1 Tax=Flavobacterium rivulicola TaxID=2732161 RepID=A0A7Y3VYB9_9FLAO|nr:hypothetical protein [Flavobacterium sp. IMCC34852]NNT71508.1 hypothetical protein [Flavobacterium sp. IMCC34852]
MIDQINKLIQINLLLFLYAKHKPVKLQDFKNHDGNPLPGAKMLAEIMQQKELIKNYSEKEFCYELTELGKYIAESGGWLNHVEKLKMVKPFPLSNTNSKAKKTVRKLNKVLIIAGILILLLSCLIVSSI